MPLWWATRRNRSVGRANVAKRWAKHRSVYPVAWNTTTFQQFVAMIMISSFQSHNVEPVLIIEPGRTEKNYWTDLWRYRELFLVLAWRDLSVRYKQTIIGVLWAIIRPLLTMVVFTVIFGRIAKLASDGSAPYALMVFAAMQTIRDPRRRQCRRY